MAKITVEKQEEILTFPKDSILELKIEESNIEEVNGRSGPWEKVSMKFKILGIQAIGDGGSTEPYMNWIGQSMWGSVPFKLTDHPENKLRIWSEAIFRQELGVGFELDTDMFVGRQVRGVTGTYQKTLSNGDKVERHQIDTLLPFGGGQPATPRPAQAAAPAPQQTAQDPWGAPASNTWDEPPF